MDGLYLVVRIAGETVALATDAVVSVVEVDAITPVPRVPPHVAGLFALRSRVLTVIDGRVALAAGMMARDGALPAVVISIDGHDYAILVDEVEDVTTSGAPSPCGAVLGPAWARAAIGQIESEGRRLPLIDPAALLTEPPARAA